MSESNIRSEQSLVSDLPRVSKTLLIYPLLVFLVITPVALPQVVAAQAASSALKDCVIEVPNGSSIQDQYSVRLSDGTIKNVSPRICTGLNPPTIDDWVMKTEAFNAGGFTSLSDYWLVPNNPVNTNDPLLYFFDGFQGVHNNAAYILQPVLAWGCFQRDIFGNCQVGGSYWWLASWLVFSAGPFYRSPIINVSAGNEIKGSLTWIGSGCNGNGTGGPGFQVNGQVTGGAATYLYFCTGSNATKANSAALEAYRLNSCNQLPSQPFLTFRTITVNPAVSSWTIFENGNSPQCAYDVKLSPANMQIYSYPTTDTYVRSHGLAIDQSLPNPWWPPYQSGFEFKVTGSAFNYYTSPSLSTGNHYLWEAASGFVPNYAWHTRVYVNGLLRAEGDVGRSTQLQATFDVSTVNHSLHWTS